MPLDTTDRLRSDIDSGKTGDKQPGPDPSAAPLGTDDEAGGDRPSTSKVSTAREGETGGTLADHSVEGAGLGHAWILIGFVVLLAIGLVAFMIWRRG